MREVAKGVGFLLHIPAVMALLSMPVAWLAGEPWGVPGLAVTTVVALAAGQLLIFLGRGATTFHRYQSMQIAGISWLLIAMLGAVPFALSAVMAPGDSMAAEALSIFQFPVFALFESTSGFTSTGLTVVARASELPAHIQWWRSFSEWVGGIGVILLLVAILPAERGALNLYFSEAREEKILPTVKSTVRAIWLIYLGFTLFGIALLWMAGEPLWRAVNHGMTAIATGGFSITDDSLMSTPAAVQIAYMPLMLIGAISFLVHYRILMERPGWRVIGQSTELRLLFWIALGGILLLWAQRWLAVGDAGGVATAFIWISALTSAGFTSVDLALWMNGPLLLVLVAVLMGGMAGSTSGGVKLLRVGLLLKDLQGQLKGFRASRHEVVMVRYEGRRMAPGEIAGLGRIAARLVGLFMLLWLLGVFVMLHLVPSDVRLAHVFFDTASALFNSGLSTGVAGPAMGAGAAFVLSVLMLLGRLEIFPLLVLAGWAFGRR